MKHLMNNEIYMKICEDKTN